MEAAGIRADGMEVEVRAQWEKGKVVEMAVDVEVGAKALVVSVEMAVGVSVVWEARMEAWVGLADGWVVMVVAGKEVEDCLVPEVDREVHEMRVDRTERGRDMGEGPGGMRDVEHFGIYQMADLS